MFRSTKRAESSVARTQSRQKMFNRIVLVAILVVTVAITAYAFTRSTSVPLPPYLDRCIPLTGSYVYRSTPQLLLNISGIDQTVPANIGVAGSCIRPIFTLSATGVIHIVTDQDRNYTLGDFFLVWGNSYGPDFAKFNQNQIFSNPTGNGHSLAMDVCIGSPPSCVPNHDFQNYVFPRNAN